MIMVHGTWYSYLLGRKQLDVVVFSVKVNHDGSIA